ncbi:MAG TPA: UvrD-helicase domain-containing protein [Acidimicrobiales bacterium]|nr:UvrD-helicase domain-containing protein [Acidimicrobiales bacterium]
MNDDAAARQAVAHQLDRTLFVEAGAGTGKTTALVGRIVALVEAGAEMRRIAAITFTEAAAAELRNRTRAALQAAAAEGRVPADAVAQVDEAAISTLHAFAQRILAEHPLEAGLPPSFDVLDEVEAALAFEERWAEFLDALLDDPAYETTFLWGFATGLDLRRLQELALAMADHHDRLDLAATGPATTAPPAGPLHRGALITALQTAAAFLPECTADDDLLAGHLARLPGVATRLAGARTDVEFLHLVDNLPTLSSGKGRQENWAPPVDDVRAACQVAEDERLALLDGVRQQVLGHLLGALVRFTLAGAGERARAGHLTFHDLLVLARDLVRTDAQVRAALRTRYSHLLIDEFQDTDPLQLELAVLLAAAEDTPPGTPWHQVPIAPGRLFFVGDPKQSIYRFRRADIGLFLDVRDRLAGAGGPVRLTRNFRSVPGVLAWVNHVFEALMGSGTAGAQAPYDELEPARSALAEDVAPVVLLGGEQAGAIGAVREKEAEEIAATVNRIINEAWVVGAEPGRPGHAAHLADIAILLPTRTSLPQLEAALDDAEVPYRVESASLVWGTQEVADLLAVLRAVDDPADQVAVVAALRSPTLACGDDDLLAYRQAGGRWDLQAEPPEALPPDHPVLAGLASLRELHHARWWHRPSALVERVMRDLRMFELALAHRRPRDHWRRLRWVLDQVRAFESEGGGGAGGGGGGAAGRTLRDFVTWATQQAADDARMRESALPEADDDAVRILTVHGAKGLEFPVVILAGLNRANGGGSPTRVLWDDEGRPQARASRFRTPGFAALADQEREMERHEQLRLLYVAATRARDHLVVSLHHRAGDRTAAAELARLCEAAPHLVRRLDPPFALRAQVASSVPRTRPDAAAVRRAWSAEREDRIARLRRAPVRAATTLAGIEDMEPGVHEDGRGRRGRAGTSIGRAVHAVLQAADLTTGRDVTALARAAAAAENVDERAAEVERLARAALASSAVAQAVSSRHWRELYVGVPVGDTLLEGFVDLLYESPEGLVVVDYKTDALRSDAEIDRALDRYRWQGGAYALALERSLGRPVARCTFVFLAGSEARQRGLPDLRGAMAEVERVLTASA